MVGSCYPRVSPSFVAPAIRSLTTEGCHVGNACQELLDQHVLATVVPSWVSPSQKLKQTWPRFGTVIYKEETGDNSRNGDLSIEFWAFNFNI